MPRPPRDDGRGVAVLAGGRVEVPTTRSTFTFDAADLARLFAASDVKQAILEILVDALIAAMDAGRAILAADVNKELERLGISSNPLAKLESVNIIDIGRDGRISLHPIVSEELNLWPHLLDILRTKFGIVVSKRMHDLGRYLKYMDNLGGQLRFLKYNLNVEESILHEAIKGLYTIRVYNTHDKMSFQDALKFYKQRDKLEENALNALRTLGENMHLLSAHDMVSLKPSLLNIDKVAAQTEAVKQEFTKFSVNAFLHGIIKFDDMLEYENTDEFITLSLLMRGDRTERINVEEIGTDDPVANLIRKFLHRDLPKGKRKRVIQLVASFFREFMVREGFLKDLNALVNAMHQRELDIKQTMFSTMKKMQMWTPVFKDRIKASSRSLIMVNDLSGSMIASYVGQVELFQGVIDAMTQDVESEIVFVSFSNDTFAVNQATMQGFRDKDTFLGLLTENTMGMTDINTAFETLASGRPARGDRFKPPNPDDTIVFFVSDLQETIGGSIDFELAGKVIKSCRKFFIPVPRSSYHKDNHDELVALGAVPVPYDNILEIPPAITRLAVMEMVS